MGAFDLYHDEVVDRLSSLPAVKDVEAGTFDGFLRGAAYSTMRGFARTARAVDLLGSIGPIAEDAFTGGTEAQDRYFKEHDETFGRAVDSWTLKPGEVGVAGEVVGGLLSTLPLVIASPSLAVGTAQLAAGEELAQKGVSPVKAGAVGAIQGAGLGVGIWLPILGSTGWQRILVGGAAGNVAQGVATRGASELVLAGTPASGEFKAFDGEQLTLDALLGMAFGTLAHISPAQRAQGAEIWKRIEGWAKGLPPSDVDAIAALRQAQHLNVDSAPGTPADLGAIQSHTQAMRQAIDDVLAGRQVNIDDIVAGAQFLPDEQRNAFRAQAADYLAEQARAILNDEILTHEQQQAAQDVPGFLRSAEELMRAREGESQAMHPDLARAVEIAKKPGFQRTALEKLYLESFLSGDVAGRFDELAPLGKPTEAPPTSAAEPPPPRSGEAPGGAEVREPADPLAAAARQFADQQPELRLNVGADAEGRPITRTPAEFLDDARAEVTKAQENASLFEVAARCLFGGGA